MNNKNCIDCQHFEGELVQQTFFEPEDFIFECSTIENSSYPNIDNIWENWTQKNECDTFASCCPHYQKQSLETVPFDN